MKIKPQGPKPDDIIIDSPHQPQIGRDPSSLRTVCPACGSVFSSGAMSFSPEMGKARMNCCNADVDLKDVMVRRFFELERRR